MAKRMAGGKDSGVADLCGAGAMSAVVLGDQGSPDIRKVVGLLKPHFFRVDVLEQQSVRGRRRGAQEPALVVVTDTVLKEPAKPAVFKESFPEAGLFGLLRVIDRATELAFRSAGTLFLGSYETFYAYSDAILASFFTGAGRSRQPNHQNKGGSTK